MVILKSLGLGWSLMLVTSQAKGTGCGGLVAYSMWRRLAGKAPSAWELRLKANWSLSSSAQCRRQRLLLIAVVPEV